MNSSPDAAAALVIAVAIQQSIEALDALLTVLGTWTGNAANWKKLILKLVALALGLSAAATHQVDILKGFANIGGFWHVWVTALALAGGTEGVNSALKYAGYAKENKKNDAAAKLNLASMSDGLKVMNTK